MAVSEGDNFQIDQRLNSQLRYTEQVVASRDGVARRRCCLWADGVQDDVSQATLLSFDIRFGQVSVPAEGYAGVQTRPEHRQKGYVRTVMVESLRRAAQRVDVAFLFGIEQLYGKFCFVTCLPQTHLVMSVRRIDRAGPVAPGQLRPIRPGDLPRLVELYNRQHAVRPWTWSRNPQTWNRLPPPEIWRPGVEVTVLEEADQPRGYMILRGIPYGAGSVEVSVHELTAADSGACHILLAEAARRCWEHRLGDFRLYEPPDSLTGRVSRRLGCDVVCSWRPDGGGMGAVLNRTALVQRLRPELDRRLTTQGLQGSESAIHALAQGELCPDDRMLLRLLFGFWSWAEAEEAGYRPPERFRSTFCGWFCGGGTAVLPLPFSHPQDHY